MRHLSAFLGLLCLPLIAVALFFPPIAIYVVPVLVVLSLALLAGRFYVMTNTAWAQITAVGISLQIGSVIIGWAPESWWKSRGLDRRSLWPSCLAIVILAVNYSNGVRTAFGIDVGSARIQLKSKGRYRSENTTAETGWLFWRRSLAT